MNPRLTGELVRDQSAGVPMNRTSRVKNKFAVCEKNSGLQVFTRFRVQIDVAAM